MSGDHLHLSTPRAGPAFLVSLHVLICCLSLVFVMRSYGYLLQTTDMDEGRLYAAVLNVAAFALFSVIFTVARFSFGYIVGFYFYTVVLGFLWLVEFTEHQYDHTLSALSAFVSGI